MEVFLDGSHRVYWWVMWPSSWRRPVTKWLHWFAIQQKQRMLPRSAQPSTKVTSRKRKACVAP